MLLSIFKLSLTLAKLSSTWRHHGLATYGPYTWTLKPTPEVGTQQEPPPDEPPAPSFLHRRRQSLPGFCGEPEENPPHDDTPPHTGPPGRASPPPHDNGAPGCTTGEQRDIAPQDTAETTPGRTQRPATANRRPTFAMAHQHPEPLAAEPHASSPFLTNPMEKLIDCVTSLAKMQEASAKQQGELNQRKIDGNKSVHRVTSNFIHRTGTPNGIKPADHLFPLAEAMLGAKDKSVALELFCVELADPGVRYQISPAFFEALYTGSFLPKTFSSSQTTPPARSFGCAASFAGTRLEELDIPLTYRKLDDKASLTDKEKQGLYSQTVLICMMASQLTRTFRITAHAFEAYMP